MNGNAYFGWLTAEPASVMALRTARMPPEVLPGRPKPN